MPVLRQCRAERIQNIDLTRRVIHVIITTNDVGNLHIPVIHRDAKIVSWRAIRTRNDQIVQLFIADRDRSLTTSFQLTSPSSGFLKRITGLRSAGIAGSVLPTSGRHVPS
jgi:hypothetical protein